MSDRSPRRLRRWRDACAPIVAALAVFVVLVPGGAPSSGEEPPADLPVTPAAPRFSDLRLELVDREYHPATTNWTLTALATLSSNRLCFPLVFDCIVGETSSPANAELVDLDCESMMWNHLLVFRNHCLRQIGHAGHHQKFLFIWETDPGVATGTVALSVEFGRGVLPLVFQQLAEASLTVNLDTSLDLAKECPPTVDAGDPVVCTVKVSYPAAAGPAIAATIVDTPDGTQVTGGTLTQAGGTPSWTCVSLTCSATVSPGAEATFSYSGTAASSPTGGEGSNTVQFTAGGSAQVTVPVTVVGTGDTTLAITKTAQVASAPPGSPVSWTVTVENTGVLAATDVVLTDIAPVGVEGLTLSFSSGVGTWSCAALSCTTASMPVGVATFSASGTVSSSAVPGSVLLNEVDVSWVNDILGPDWSEVAGAAVVVQQGATTTTAAPAPTTTAAPATTAAPSGGGGATGGAPLTFTG